MKTIVYSLLSLLYPNGKKTCISGINIRLPLRYARYYEADYEKENVLFFKTYIKPNNTVIDIGAQIGLMTKLFSDLVGKEGRVYAFEPTPKTFETLKKTIQLNEIAAIAHPIMMAAAEGKKKSFFNISSIDIDAANSLSNTERNAHTYSIEVDVTSVDHFVSEQGIKQVDFIKVDAEGAEYFVLLGARNTILKNKPLINLALHPKEIKAMHSSLKNIYELIEELNYNVFYKENMISMESFVKQNNLFDVQLIPKSVN
jgi:FkbM family methyltransferase